MSNRQTDEPGETGGTAPSAARAVALLEATINSGDLSAGLAAAAEVLEVVIQHLGPVGPFDAETLRQYAGAGQSGQDFRRALDAGVYRLRLSAGALRLLAQALQAAHPPAAEEHA